MRIKKNQSALRYVLSLIIMLVLVLTFSLSALAVTDVMFVTNGSRSGYIPGSTVVVYGKLTNEGYAVAGVGVRVQVTLRDALTDEGTDTADEGTIFISAPKTDTAGYFKSIFNIPLTAEAGQEMLVSVNGNTATYVLLTEEELRESGGGGGGGGGGNDSGPMQLVGFTKGTEGSLGQANIDEISVGITALGLFFNKSVNYFRNGGAEIDGLQDLGPIDRNADCFTLYENGTTSVPITVNLVSNRESDAAIVVADTITLLADVESSILPNNPQLRHIINVQPVGGLKAGTEYKLVISRNLINNGGVPLGEDIEVYYKTASSTTDSPVNPPSGGGGGYIPPSGGGDVGGPAPPATTTVTPGTPANNGTAYTLDAREVQKNTDGSQTLTGVGTLTTDGGTKISLPAGTTVAVNGTITVPATGKAELEMSGGTATINGGATINADGSLITKGNTDIVLKGGTTVAIPANSGISGEKVIIGAAGARTETKSGLTFALRENAVLTLSETAPLGYNTEVELPFTDVGSEWYASHVRFAYAHGLTSGGGSQTTFNPAEELTRGMLVTMLSRMDSDPQFTGDLEFTDLKQEWYTKAVGWAAEKGIVLGDGNGLFRPDDSITREQLVTILYRYAGQMGYNTAGSPVLSGYTDSDKVSAYAMEAMKWANAEGIMRGRTENTLVPQGNTSRAETMVILQRFIEKIK